MKINKIVKLVIITLITITAFLLIPGHKVQAASKLKLDVSYSYNKKKDVVTVKVKSNNKLKDTKSSWKLSKKGYTYTKKFYANQKYETTFTDIYGNKKTKKIKVKQIKGPQITVEYKYDSSKNKVKVSVKSNKKLADTKPTWTLSKKKYTYTKFFKANQKYETTFTDTYGNTKTKKIKVNQIDDVGPKATITYTYSSDAKSVVVTITSNEELRKSLNDKWELSKDKKVYKRTFVVNTEFGITLKDKYKNPTLATIKITDIGKIAFANKKIVVNVKSSSTVSTKKDVYKGVDVSSHQAKIDWQKVKDEQIDFAILRCGYGKNSTSQDDSTFIYNMKECERLSIPYGVYLYSYALNTDDAKSEAKHVLRLIEGHNPKYGIWFDMEDADGYKAKRGMPSNKKLVNICDTFCEYIKNKGYSRVGIYANLNWWNTKLNSSKLDAYDKWLARWPTKNGVQTGDSTLSSGESIKTCIIWQYTSKGKVDGITGNVDMNYCYRTY